MGNITFVHGVIIGDGQAAIMGHEIGQIRCLCSILLYNIINSYYPPSMAISINFIVLVVLPFDYLGTTGLLFLWSILSWVIALLLLLIEFPFFVRYVPSNSALERFVDWTRHHLFRAGSCLLYCPPYNDGRSFCRFSIALGASFIASFSWLLVAAMSLIVASVCYAVSFFKEPQVNSVV